MSRRRTRVIVLVLSGSLEDRGRLARRLIVEQTDVTILHPELPGITSNSRHRPVVPAVRTTTWRGTTSDKFKKWGTKAERLEASTSSGSKPAGLRRRRLGSAGGRGQWRGGRQQTRRRHLELCLEKLKPGQRIFHRRIPKTGSEYSPSLSISNKATDRGSTTCALFKLHSFRLSRNNIS